MNIILDWSAHKPIGHTLKAEATNVEHFIENITYTTSNILKDVVLRISQKEAVLAPSISPYDLIKDLDDIFNDIDDIGDYPPGYTNVRGAYEAFKDQRFRGDIEQEYYPPYAIKELFDPFFRPMGVDSDLDWNWADWADEDGYPDLAGKIKSANGKYYSRTSYVAVTYSKKTRTITLYERVLGNPNYYQAEWFSAFAFGVFLAYFHDAYVDTKIVSTTLIFSLAEYAVYRYEKDVLSQRYLCERRYRNWRSLDMAYWPYSGGLFFCDIQILNKRIGDSYFFVRTFKRSLKDSKGAFDDLKAAYRLYEGRDFIEGRRKSKSPTRPTRIPVPVMPVGTMIKVYIKKDGLVLAEGYYNGNTVVVEQGSQLSPSVSAYCPPRIITLRNELSANGTINAGVFVRDHVFNSPSQAAATIRGVSSDGWYCWKDAAGKTLHELVRK